jgi:hypothetical protein
MPLNPYVQIEQPSSMQQQNNNDAAFLAQLLQMPQYTQQRGGGSNNGLQNSLAKALRGNSSSYNPNSFGGSTSNDLSAYTPWNQGATANTYGTDPYSQQSIMLAQQDAGLNDSPWLGNFSFDNIGSGIGNIFNGIGDWFGSSALPEIGTTLEEAAPAAAAAA